MEKITKFRPLWGTNKTKQWLGLLTFCLIWIIGQTSLAQTTVSLGTYTGAGSTNVLLSTSTTTNKYSRTISIYTASEILLAGGMPGNITSLAWDKNGTGEYTTADAYIKIYLKHTTNDTWSSIPEWNTEVIGATEVFTSSTYSIPTGTGWKEVVFNAPFEWNGVDNIAVMVEWSRQSAPTADITWGRSTTPSANATRVGSSGLEDLVFLINDNRPLLQLTITPSGPITCPIPTGLTVSNITSDSAEVSWTSDGNLFEIEYGPLGFTQGTGTLIENITSSPYTFTNLNPLTTYQFYIRRNCGDDDGYSSRVGSSFTTACGTLIPPTTTQTFTGFTGAAPGSLPCWSEAKGTLDNPLTGTESLWANQTYNSNLNSSHPFGTALYINLYSSARDGWFISPPVDLGDGSVPYQMEFDVSVTPWTGTADVTALGDSFVKVVVSTDGGETWSSTNVLHTYDNNDIPTGGGREDVIPLTGYTGVVTVAFYAHSQVLTGTPDVKFYIDNWKIVPVPTCPKPTFLGISGNTYTTADLTWNSDGDTFDIEYGLAGFTPTGNPSPGLTGVAHPYTLTGLTPETNYQYYVRQDCGEGDVSLWAGPFNFYTGYCLASSTGTGNRITGFATTDGYTNINNLSNGTTNGYNNYSNMVVTQSPGGTFNYTITVPANTVVDIWVDIDQNF